MKLSFTLAILLVAHVTCKRVDKKSALEDALQPEGEQESQLEEQVQGCKAENCKTFAEDAKCPCKQFLGTDLLKTRLHSILYNALQSLRKVSDKLTEESGAFSKLWWGASVGSAQGDLKLLEEAVGHMPDLLALMREKLPDQITSADFEVPAAVFPVTVEIWDDNTVSRQTFIGETGVSLVEGEHEYDRPLQLNSHHTGAYVKPHGTVSFGTSVTKSAPFDCDIAGLTRCVHMKLEVKCHGAKDLPNTDTGVMGDVTDAYCKVRIKKIPITPAEKHKTGVVSNSLNPVFTRNNHIVAEWDVPILEPFPQNREPSNASAPEEAEWVSWTHEHMSLAQQMDVEAMYLAGKVFLDDGSKCKKARWAKICGILNQMTQVTVDASALQALEAETEEMGKKTSSSLIEMFVGEEVQGDVFVGQLVGVHQIGAAVAGRNAHLREYGLGDAGAATGPGGEKFLSVAGAIMLIVFLIICMALFI